MTITSKFATPAASPDYFEKKQAAEDRAVVSFFVTDRAEVEDRFNAGEMTTRVTADVVVHPRKEVYRDSRIFGALAGQLKMTPGKIVDGRMGFGKSNDKAIVIDCDDIDADTRAAIESFYELNAERTEDGFRLRDDVTFDLPPAASEDVPNVEEEPF